VDRDGELFKIILQYLRTHRRPSSQALHSSPNLLHEADFYGCEALQNELAELTSDAVLDPKDRELRDQEIIVARSFWDSAAEEQVSSREDYLIDVFARLPDFQLHDRKAVKYPLLLESACPVPATSGPSISASSAGDIHRRLSRFTRGLLDRLRDEAIVVAGGSVVAALTNSPTLDSRTSSSGHDLDIFLCGVSQQRADEIFNDILTSLKQLALDDVFGGGRLIVVRTKVAVTMYLNDLPPVQVVLAVYQSPLEVIINFDVDCCCVLYHPATKRVLCTPR